MKYKFWCEKEDSDERNNKNGTIKDKFWIYQENR